ncbi:uncharacterized protein LOC144144179 isoform X1 [Haemaphysalis longicornis]
MRKTDSDECSARVLFKGSEGRRRDARKSFNSAEAVAKSHVLKSCRHCLSACCSQQLACLAVRTIRNYATNLMFDFAALRLGCFSRVCAVRRLCNGDLEENMSWYFTRSQIHEIHRVASHCDLQTGYYPRPVWPHWPQWPSWLPSPWRWWNRRLASDNTERR